MCVIKLFVLVVIFLCFSLSVKCDIIESTFVMGTQLILKFLQLFDGSGTSYLKSRTEEQLDINLKQHPELVKSPLIKIHTGWVQGRHRYTKNEKVPFYSFQGIPYAAPPIGDLRFMPTAPVAPWKGVKKAFIENDKCPQRDPFFGLVGNEDCLYINIYTPYLPDNSSTSNSELRAVMFWIHGGDTVSGAGNNNSGLYGPDYLVEKDLVVVTFNYRLGVLGFLSTEDMAAPGNNGLRDQIQALKWVQANIAFFGGDPQRVTISGQSSGASCTDLLIISPLTKGLFHRGIMQSGSSLTKWAMTEKPRDNAFKYAQLLSINTTNSTVLIQELKKLSTWVLLTTSIVSTFRLNLYPWNGYVFHPVIEPIHEDAVISESPLISLRKGNFVKVPLIIGFTAREAAFTANVFQSSFLRTILGNYFEVMVPPNLHIPFGSKEMKTVIKKIKQYYFFNKKILPLDKVIDYVGDHVFKLGVWKAAKYHALRNRNVYFYRFEFDGNYNFFKRYFRVEGVKGASHTEELGYEWIIKGLDENNESNSTLTRKRFLTLISNFVKTGNPTPYIDDLLQNIKWPRVSDSKTPNMHYLNIDTNLQLGVNPDHKTMKFWDDLFIEYARPPYLSY